MEKKIKVRRKPTLKEALERAGMTKAELARKLKPYAHTTTVYRWFDEDTPQVPRNKYKVQIQDLLGTHIRWPEPTTTKWSAANKQTPRVSLDGHPPGGLAVDIKEAMIKTIQKPTSPASEILQKEEELKRWVEHAGVLWRTLGERINKFQDETGLTVKAIGLKMGKDYWGQDERPKIYILREKA